MLSARGQSDLGADQTENVRKRPVCPRFPRFLRPRFLTYLFKPYSYRHRAKGPMLMTPRSPSRFLTARPDSARVESAENNKKIKSW